MSLRSQPSQQWVNGKGKSSSYGRKNKRWYIDTSINIPKAVPFIGGTNAALKAGSGALMKRQLQALVKREQDESIHIINLQIEREFIRKADVVALMNHLAKQLDRIEQKLDGKADK